MSRAILSYCAPLFGAVFLSGCITDGTTPPHIPVTVAAPQMGWRLPKTVLDATVTWTPKSCEVKNNIPVVDVDVSVAIAARGVPDDDIGPKYPNGLVTVSTGTLQSFWVDSNLTYKVWNGRGGLLQSLSSHSTGETGPIIGNFLTGITKIVGLAVAAPLGKAPVNGEACGTANATLATIKDLRKQIQAASDSKKAQDLATRVQTLKDSITVTVKETINPGIGKYGFDKSAVATIKPDDDEVKRAGWYGDGATENTNTPESHLVKILFDIPKGILCPGCKAKATSLAKTMLPDGALFRQAAYIPVYAEQGPWTQKDGDLPQNKKLGDTQIIAFGQFGNAASLPIKAKSFQDINWEVDFTDLGEITQTTFASKATGMAVSSMFSGAATAAAGIQSGLSTAAAAPDSATAALSKENTAMKAQIDNKNYKTQLEALGIPSSASPAP